MTPLAVGSAAQSNEQFIRHARELALKIWMLVKMGMADKLPQVRRHKSRKLKKLFTYLLIGIAAVILVLAVWPYQLVASPKANLCIVDDGKQPLAGLRVVRFWDTSEGQKGQEVGVTDSKGEVSFKRVAASMSLLKRLTKPLLIFVPASCGPGWEVYGHSEFHIYWPDGYTLKFDDAAWKRVSEVYQNRDGVCIRDPAIVRQFRHENYVELYFFNKREDFHYTLTVYRKDNP